MPTPSAIKAINLAIKAEQASTRLFGKTYEMLVEHLRGMVARNEVITDDLKNLNVTMAVAVEDAMTSLEGGE